MLSLRHGASPLGATLSLGLVLVLSSGAIVSGVLPGGAQEAGPGAAGGDDTPFDPYAQPIDFSHRHHVTEMGIDCQMCHVYARRSPVAGIPSVQKCAGCHTQVMSDTPEVQKVLEYWDNERPIPWIRVHDLPDHVRFSHKRHVLGGVDCAECHGDVGQMEIAVQVESLSMGWCVACHDERSAKKDCLACHY